MCFSGGGEQAREGSSGGSESGVKLRKSYTTVSWVILGWWFPAGIDGFRWKYDAAVGKQVDE